jgi:glycosyltransferase involved in cell wall biosynthesis
MGDYMENSKLFSLVMPCYKCEDTIKKAIDSIIDQDIENWELICVINGKWNKRPYLEKILNKYAKKDNRISVVFMEEGSACTARNIGGEKASGKYIAFFSSDFYMFPGALRKWEQTFKEHSEADFIYSGYRLMENGEMLQGLVPSIPFDEWQLQMGNYIDGGFPMKREVFEKTKWDPSVKSLNDWDFWLSAVDNGFKGYYMPDLTYAAEIPKPGGLSYDSHANWLERVEFIKKKHKIPLRDICVVSLGAQPHAKKIAKILDADFSVAPQTKPNKYKMIYLIGSYFGDGSSAVAHSQVFSGNKGSKKLIHWIGSDILQLMIAGNQVCYNHLKAYIDGINSLTNLVEFQYAKDEMGQMGVNAEIVPLPVESKWDIMPLPKKFTVAIYYPHTATSQKIYNLKLMEDIVKSCPNIDFIFFGGGSQLNLPNLKNYGWIEMGQLLKESSCILRVTQHDGMPITPIEFKLAGREAITSIPMEYVYSAGSGVIHDNNYAERKESIIKLLNNIKKEIKTRDINEVKKAREYYLDLCSPEKFKKRIYGMIDDNRTDKDSKKRK